jgi:polar amino acid transport system substrate-binding protein
MRNFLVVFMSILLVLAVAACGSPTSNGNTESQESETTLERAKRDGFVTVGFANEAPYAYATPEGKLTGEAVEVARAVLKKMGIDEMDGVLTEFGSLIPGLQAKRFDMITAGMYVTPDRCKQVSFADPEYSIGVGLAVQAGNPLNLKSYEDIVANPNATIAVMGGAIEADYLKALGIADKQIITVADQPSAVSALQAGRADATTMTGPALQSILEGVGSDVERVMDFTQPVIDGESVRGYGATAFRQIDSDFRDAFNKELNAMKESGELLEIISQFGFTAQELPGDMTAKTLCK